MLDSMFRESTERVLMDRVNRPLRPRIEQPGFGLSVWNTMTAPARALPPIAFEMGAFASDMLGAFGTTQAGIGLQADPTLLFDSEGRQKRIREGEQARQQVASGEAFSTDLGDNLRARARDMVPDPLTASAAEQFLFDGTRLIGKAVGYSLLGGPIVGAVLTGADEGLTDADRLKQQGVDPLTRTKAAMVTGVNVAGMVALPVAGKTVAGTAGLIVAGGPVGFMAQQAATKAILENANYEQLANQYDPFDPVGLAVSTLVPAAFGGIAMRSMRNRPAPVADPAAARALADMAGNERLALKYDDPRLDAYAVTAAQRESIPPEVLLALKNAGERSGPTAVSPKGAQGVMQFMPDTWSAFGRGDPRDPIASIDAGARFMRQLIDQYGGDVRAAIAHYNGGGKAGEAVRAGKQPPAAETRNYLKRVDEFIAERQGTEAGRAMASDPDAVAAARVALVRKTVESWNLKDPTDLANAEQHLAAVLRASDQLGAGEAVSVSRDLPLDDLAQTRLLDDMIGRLEQARADLLPDVGNVLEPGSVKQLRDEITQLKRTQEGLTDEALKARVKEIQQTEGLTYKRALAAAKKEFDNQLADANARIERLENQLQANRIAEETRKQVSLLDNQIEQVKQDRSQIGLPTPKAGALAVRQAFGAEPTPPRNALEVPKPATRTPETATKPAESASGGAQSAKPDAGQGNTAAAALDAQTAEIARLSPDMMVQLEGMEQPMRLADALEAVKAEAAKEAADAPLLQVAAECFLRTS